MTGRTDRIYDVNIKRLALLTLPTWLRRPLCGALIYAGVSPLGRLLNELRMFRKMTGYRLGHNGQVCRLRGVLNDMFDPDKRRIGIEEGSGDGAEVSKLWKRETGRWVMLGGRGHGAAIIRREGFGGTGGYDFWVTVPAGLLTEEGETRLRGVVNTYKLASKRYDINYK